MASTTMLPGELAHPVERTYRLIHPQVPIATTSVNLGGFPGGVSLVQRSINSLLFDNTIHIQTSCKAPAHKDVHVEVDSIVRGETYSPKPPKKKRARYVAPPMRGPQPTPRGDRAIYEIAYYQNNTGFLVPKKPMERLIRGITQKMAHKVGINKFRFAPEALCALRVTTESYLVSLYEEANLIALYAKRVTVSPEDAQLALTLRERWSRGTGLEGIAKVIGHSPSNSL